MTPAFKTGASSEIEHSTYSHDIMPVRGIEHFWNPKVSSAAGLCKQEIWH